jgi:nucleoside-diphosphate-sugar epimerase
MRVTIAGASGFIGKNLLKEIDSSYEIRGLSRSKKSSEKNIEWVQADLFSFSSVSKAMKDTDIAIYLVHSMLPTSRLFQGNFQDTDLFLADNFASACKENNIKQIIYMGGLKPINSSSKHLESRMEVEEVFKSTGIPTTVLRAGMVVGDGGSSFEVLKNLVLNLPAMVLPKWTKSSTQTIYIDDLLRVINFCIDNQDVYNKKINVVNGEETTYEKLIKQSSKYFGGSKLLIPVPINYTSFSKLWVMLFGETDYELVSPLIDSLKCDLIYPEIPKEIEELVVYRTFESMLKEIPKEKKAKRKSSRKDSSNNVRSIQRLSSDQSIKVEEVSRIYVDWLPKYMKNIIKAKWEDDVLNFNLVGLSKPLLSLTRQEEWKELDRIKLHITGGLLTKTTDTGWLEFRKVAGGKYTLASINEFVPSLPWYLYKFTQAKAHLKVMHDFSDYLERKSRE